MNKKEVLNIVNKLSTDIATNFGYELVDVEFVKESSNHFLRVYIDKPGGVNLDDCQNMSQELSNKLDDINVIDISYYLEVSSPGLDRPLKTNRDLKRNIDEEVEVSLYKGIDGKKKFLGRLIGFNEEFIKIIDEQENEIDLPRKIVAKINLAVKF